MAGRKIADEQYHIDFFRSRIEMNIRYWQTTVASRNDIDILGQEFHPNY